LQVAQIEEGHFGQQEQGRCFGPKNPEDSHPFTLESNPRFEPNTNSNYYSRERVSAKQHTLQ